MVLYNEAIKIRAEALLKIVEAQTKYSAAKNEETRMGKWQLHVKLEGKDTSNYSEEKLQRHEAMLNKLAKELGEEYRIINSLSG